MSLSGMGIEPTIVAIRAARLDPCASTVSTYIAEYICNDIFSLRLIFCYKRRLYCDKLHFAFFCCQMVQKIRNKGVSYLLQHACCILFETVMAEWKWVSFTVSKRTLWIRFPIRGMFINFLFFFSVMLYPAG